MAIIYTPQRYKIEDVAMQPFIDEGEISDYLDFTKHPSIESVREVISKAIAKSRLTLRETALLINANSPEATEEILHGARKLKEQVYGQRIVLFAPLYIGNYCTNDCSYCGFRSGNKLQVRLTLDKEEIIEQVTALQDVGHKRLILVFGEHPAYSPRFIAKAVNTVYSVKSKNGAIRRVNINAAPFDVDGFRIIKEAGIGTYQIFQETYSKSAYARVHPTGQKSDYNWRLTALDRAQEAGIDDVGIGALLGLHDWRFELLGLVRHVNHLEAVYNVGPHTISFPRIKKASGTTINMTNSVSDADFIRMVAILRLAVPYAGLILTAREPASIRDEVLNHGVSQIDGGSNIEMKGYTSRDSYQNIDLEQFELNDNRSLQMVISDLVNQGHIPSFCTACYRLNRTGEHFMEFTVPGFIKRFCQPNALVTFAEYLEDYATPEDKLKGYQLIANNLSELPVGKLKNEILDRIDKIKTGERDINF